MWISLHESLKISEEKLLGWSFHLISTFLTHPPPYTCLNNVDGLNPSKIFWSRETRVTVATLVRHSLLNYYGRTEAYSETAGKNNTQWPWMAFVWLLQVILLLLWRRCLFTAGTPTWATLKTEHHTQAGRVTVRLSKWVVCGSQGSMLWGTLRWTVSQALKERNTARLSIYEAAFL